MQICQKYTKKLLKNLDHYGKLMPIRYQKDAGTKMHKCLIAKLILILYIICKKFKGAYWISSNSLFIQYCGSNIGLFSIAPPLVIAFPTLQ